MINTNKLQNLTFTLSNSGDISFLRKDMLLFLDNRLILIEIQGSLEVTSKEITRIGEFNTGKVRVDDHHGLVV